MAAKCNITSLALKKLSELYWGAKYNNIDAIILENYAESLNCGQMVICNDVKNCNNDTITFNCNLGITAISKIIDENTVTFYIADGDIIGGLEPFIYQWDYEEDDFDQSGEIDTSEAVLTVKAGKDLSLLVSIVSVMVTDANNCEFIKHCYITPSGMQCANNYAACLNISDLVVNNSITRCVNVSGLIVSKTL